MGKDSKEQFPHDQKKSGVSFKKNLAVAAIAASLGVSLGVPVSDVLAAGEKLSSPPGYSRQDKFNQSSQIKDRQSSQIKYQGQSSQFKDRQSTQIKDRQSTQMKLKESTQMKINAPKQSTQFKY